MIPFTKAHACGNDFLIIAEEDAHGYDKAVAEISGNGTRCVAAWMAEERGAQPGDQFSVETDAGARLCTIQEFRHSKIDGPTTLITADMDVPEFEERTVELADGTSIDGIHVSMGNPNFVIVLDTPTPNQFLGGNPLDASERTLSMLDFSVNDRTWDDIGQEICHHPDFPDQTNVIFVHVLGSESEPIHQAAIRIFERGVGPTTSSGTGTSASATALIALYDAEHELEVIAPGGAQNVKWQGPGEKLYLTGPATLIARGEAW